MSPKHLLPTCVKPSHYDLKLHIDLEELKFNGEVTIDIEVVEATDVITLHALALELSDAAVCQGEQCAVVTGTDMDEAQQTACIRLAAPLPLGPAQLSLKFAAPLEAKMMGLYRSQYTGADGATRHMAVTQFEAASARRCLPCWDEPALKATFSVTLDVASHLCALSNMPEESNSADAASGRKVVKFERSPIMSSYLLAVCVGECDTVEATTATGVLVRVFTPRGQASHGEYALNVAVKSLEYYADYFKIGYPLPKCDLIAVPDFSAGAMENWGLITYRESLLLVDPKNSSAQTQQRIAIIVAHEVAHQWFGNLVTMDWWTYLWLNEGYANFSEYLCVDHIFPEMKIWNLFLTYSFSPALELDSLENTHPVEVEVFSSADVDEIFDEISYDKGASVIRMLHRYLGDAAFRKGMNAYLCKHQYGNTTSEDLWAALAESSGKPVQEVMAAWTRQPGYPVVSVEAKEEGDKTVLKVSQTKFYLNGAKDTQNTKWAVPIDVKCSVDDQIRSLLLKDVSGTLELPKIPEDGWVKVNAGACGFYRTRYSSDLLKKLSKVVSAGTLPIVDRVTIIDDMLAMVKSGYSPTTDLLELLSGYSKEDEYSVFVSLRHCLSSLSSLMSHDPELKGKMNLFKKSIFLSTYEKLGWESPEGEDCLSRLLRPLALVSLGETGYPEVVAKAKELLAAHVSGSPIAPDIRACVYKICMLHGDKTTQDTFMSLYKASSSQEEKDRLSRNMGVTSNETLLKSLFEFTMKEVRSQDIPFVIYFAAFSSPEGGRFVWNYFKENYDKFVEIYGTSDLMIRLSKFVSENFASASAADEIEKFFEEKRGSVERGVRQNVEAIRLQAAWLARDRAALMDYFKAHQ